MKRTAALAALALAVTLLPAATPTLASESLDVAAVRAPIAPDGTTVGAPTDFVLTFRDRNPDVDGIAMATGGTFTVELPPEFSATGPAGNNVAVLQGWPQSPRVPFPYTIDITDNTVTLTMTSDWPIGVFGPGPKQVHLILLGFLNPTTPGRYPVALTIDPDGAGGAEAMQGTAQVRIIPRAQPSVNVISLFSGPPGPPPPFFNPVYQNVAPGESARRVGLYLWAANSVPYLNVDLEATGNPSFYRLRQDGRRVVGTVFIDAPDDAEDYSLQSVPLPPGGPPSVEVPAFVTGPALGITVGLLGVQFTPDPSAAGDYEIEIRMLGGNTEKLFVTVG